MFSGRTTVQKEFVARGIADAVEEVTGASREGVHVVFTDVQRQDWAIGPRLAASRGDNPAKVTEPAFVWAGRVRVKQGKREEYLDWRRDAVNPLMASHEGFVSATVLTTEDPDEYVILTKWTSPAAMESYQANPREADLRTEARELLEHLVKEELQGRVVDVFGRSGNA